MAYVSVPKDLTHVKSKMLFGLTKRQIVCFGAALLMGLPLFFVLRGSVPTSAAALVMIFAMLPGLLFGLCEKHGQPLEVVIGQIIRNRFTMPKARPYQTNNLYAVLERQRQMEMEVKAVVQKAKRRQAGKAVPRRKAGDTSHHPQV